MSDLLFLISEEGIAVFIIVVLIVGIAVFGRWFLNITLKELIESMATS